MTKKLNTYVKNIELVMGMLFRVGNEKINISLATGCKLKFPDQKGDYKVWSFITFDGLHIILSIIFTFPSGRLIFLYWQPEDSSL